MKKIQNQAKQEQRERLPIRRNRPRAKKLTAQPEQKEQRYNYMISSSNTSRKEFGATIPKSNSEKCANFATYQLQVYTMIKKHGSLECSIAARMELNAIKSTEWRQMKKRHTL